MEYDITDKDGFADVDVTLDQGEQIQAEPGAMVSYTPGIEMQTDTGSGSMLDSAKRSMLGGESAFMNTFVASQGTGTVKLSPPAPGDIKTRFLQNETMYAESGAFLAAEPNVTVSTSFQGASKFFKSGDVFLLELTGTGTVFIDSYGKLDRMELDQGEQFNVDTDHIVAFDASVNYSTFRPGGLKSRAFGGEGKVAKFNGPGTIWVQNDDDGVGVSDFL